MISVRGVHKWFGENRALENVSLDFAEGEVVAIVGPSGSGKTTLLRCINGLEPIDAGDIEVDGLSVKDSVSLARIRTICAMVFQQFNLYPHLTVLKNLTLAPRVVLKEGTTEAIRTALQLLEQVGLADRADAYPAELSGGQQQRVAICRALAMRPRYLLLDEVTSALDPETSTEIAELVETLAHHGTALVLVTHDLHLAERIADRVAFLEGGRLFGIYRADEFFGSSEDPRIQRYLAKMRHHEAPAPRPSASQRLRASKLREVK
jgi:ABC-type polar amino acid transport system ATPase subunit